MIKVVCIEAVMGKEYKELGYLGWCLTADFFFHALAEL